MLAITRKAKEGALASPLQWARSAVATWGVSERTGLEYVEALQRMGRVRLQGDVVVPTDVALEAVRRAQPRWF